MRRVVMLDGIVEGNSGTGVLSKRLYREESVEPVQEEALKVRFAAEGDHIQVLQFNENEKKRELKRYAISKRA